MSCTFWNMRRRLRAQKAKEQEAEAVVAENEKAETPEKKAVVENDKRSGRKPKPRASE